MLEPLDSGKYFRPLRGRTSSLWFTCVPRKAGIYTVTVTLKEADRPVSENTFLLTVIAAELPEQELIFTEWFHCDCLSTYYHVPVFSPEHWKNHFILYEMRLGKRSELSAYADFYPAS